MTASDESVSPSPLEQAASVRPRATAVAAWTARCVFMGPRRIVEAGRDMTGRGPSKECGGGDRPGLTGVTG
ncbi:hypothetical protein GCM10009576_060520 [Streptomyces rhizosphaericus]|uniref:Uncharacterized protein n=2 Tax=Streptomyces rhizosphaericus TaxID=114699 RepID=A0ABP4CYF0_9ACTN